MDNASPANQDDESVGAFAASAKLPSGTKWLVDSGAFSHMTRDRKLLADYKPFNVPQKVSLGVVVQLMPSELVAYM